ncbi:MAG: hypothetical protein CMJ18_27790 [Phycisphaeraceae bacterium]|nr:hypothetical protein [Phycisphaeraceae bacterium]
MNPQVAVIIPTCNRAAYLCAAVESVIDQTFDERVEVLVVDDGSTDDTAQAIAAYVERFGPDHDRAMVRYLHQRNQGQAVARNTALAETEAPLIAFLDDDDLFEPTKLERQVAAMRADADLAVVHSSFRYIDGDGAPMEANRAERIDNPCRGRCVDVLLDEMVVVFSSVMIRRDVVMQAAAAEDHGLPFDPALARAQDYDLLLRAARLGPFAYLEQPLLRYRLHDANHAMSLEGLKRTFGFHCRVQMSFVERFGRDLGIGAEDGKAKAARFLHGRAESHFWKRQLEVTRQLCDLARELDLHDERFMELERRAAKPAWIYRLKDGLDCLLRRGKN